jgi:sterol desaturase/sphingolipid hydroxylase (fatty acid hydroxylase superfamily)
MDRRKESKRKVSGWIHLAVLYVFCSTVMLASFYFLSNVSMLELLIMIPITIMISNLTEYCVHRFPMHKLTILKGLYKQHAGVHHRYFTNDKMEIFDSIDLQEALTNSKAILFLFAFILIPLSGLFSIISLNAGMLFLMTALAYLMFFELTHLVTHLPRDHFLLKISYFQNAMIRHRLHHNTRLMKDWNFNVSLPIWDRVFRTLK